MIWRDERRAISRQGRIEDMALPILAPSQQRNQASLAYAEMRLYNNPRGLNCGA
jgi:hypothetical protein